VNIAKVKSKFRSPGERKKPVTAVQFVSITCGYGKGRRRGQSYQKQGEGEGKREIFLEFPPEKT